MENSHNLDTTPNTAKPTDRLSVDSLLFAEIRQSSKVIASKYDDVQHHRAIPRFELLRSQIFYKIFETMTLSAAFKFTTLKIASY